MHNVLQTICTELDQLASRILAVIPSDEPFNIAHNNWSFPGLSKHDLAYAASSLAQLIREQGQATLGDNEKIISDYPRRLQYIRANTLPNIWGNPPAGSSIYLSTLDSLRNVLETALKLKNPADLNRSVTSSTSRIRSLEARLNNLEPRSEKLDTMLDRIEHAHDVADQLPTDLHSLEEARKKVDDFLDDVEKYRSKVLASSSSAEELTESLKKNAAEAESIVARCDSAYATATSQGLAAAFSERSHKLDQSMWIWVAGLVFALISEAMLGARQLQNLVDLVSGPDVPKISLGLNIALSIISVGAPIWFGWLATKQIGQRFRLSEDYAFKASVSQAYEGYRREAARIDSDLEARLLASALTRLDEQPLRLVESASYGSPWHELVSSELVKDAVKSVPWFSNQVIDAAKEVLSVTSKKKVKPVSTKELETHAD